MLVSASALLLVAALGLIFTPGIFIPFLMIAMLLLAGAVLIQRSQEASRIPELEAAAEEEEVPPQPENVESLLEVDPMEIEIGFGLIYCGQFSGR